MKKLLLLSLVLGIFLSSCTKIGDGFIVKGVVTGAKDGTAVFSSEIFTDTVKLIDGKFTFKGKLSEPIPAKAFISFDDSTPVEISFFAENSLIEIEADAEKIKERGSLRYFDDIKVKGSANDSLNRRINGLAEAMLKEPEFQAYAKYRDSVLVLRKDRNTEAMNKLSKENEAVTEHYRNESSRRRAELVAQNGKLVASAYYLRSYGGTLALDELTKLYEGLDESVKQSIAGQKVKSNIEARISLQPGKPAPDFSLETPDGGKLSLSDFRGKYVLIDFWAFWCGPCRSSFPELKKLYEKYRGEKFEILGVSVDIRKEEWLKAINDDKLPWKHAITDAEKKISALYSVQFIPCFFIIDPDGNIHSQPNDKQEVEAILEKLKIKN